MCSSQELRRNVWNLPVSLFFIFLPIIKSTCVWLFLQNFASLSREWSGIGWCAILIPHMSFSFPLCFLVILYSPPLLWYLIFICCLQGKGQTRNIFPPKCCLCFRSSPWPKKAIPWDPMFGLSCLDLSRLISAYFLSQNIIHSTSSILFMWSAEQARNPQTTLDIYREREDRSI